MIHLRRFFQFLLLVVPLGITACSRPSTPAMPVSIEPGQVVSSTDVYGNFYTYTPANTSADPDILVIVHGTPLKDRTEEWNAGYYIQSWLEFAEEHNFVLIAPVFNQEDFSSRLGDHALSGYRGLFGREIGADEWVIRLVQAHQEALGLPSEPFYLYGHSAGGQFTGRFLVTHPGKVEKAVITAAATYPQPTDEFTWPFGMRELHAFIEWDAETTNQVDIVPDRQKWLDATQVPLSVIVGLEDSSELPVDLLPGQKGRNRITIARNWVDDMAAFASANGLESRIKIDIIPGVGHSMSGLLYFSQQAFLVQ